MVQEIYVYAIISISISIGLFCIAKYVIQSKLSDLKGSSKLLGLVSLVINFKALPNNHLTIDGASMPWFP